MTCVVVFGLGDLAMRIAERLTAGRFVARVVLAGRDRERGHAFAELLAASDAVAIAFHELDVLDVTACARLLRSTRPDLVIQAACHVSPWAVARLDTPTGLALRGVGFGIQLPFQLACVRAVMLAVREVGFAGPVVNCSYPDATHAVLAGEGLAPTIGIGNAAMMQACVEQVLRREHRAELVRLVAHHAQTVPVMTGIALAPQVQPWVFVGESGRPEHALATRVPPIRWGIATNVLSAAVAVPAIRALLGGPPVTISSPGPLGLPGGYPVKIATTLALHLPPEVALEAALAHNQRIGQIEGIAGIHDGIATWTEAAATALRAVGGEFAEPLDARSAPGRADRLARALGLG